jgi:uncharacterized membrane protein
MKTFATTLAVMLLLDAVWLGLMHKIYMREYARVGALQVRWWVAVLVYLLMAAVMAWVIVPMIKTKIKENGKETGGSILIAGVMGALVYGVFNGTNGALFKEWNGWLALTDTLWGTCMFAATAWIVLRVEG